MNQPEFHAGSARMNVDPPFGLPMVGVVRRPDPATTRMGTLEVTAAAFELGATRVVVCGVDTLAIQAPEIDDIRARIAAATGATRAGIVINSSHTHHAPPGGRTIFGSFGERDTNPDTSTLAYIEYLHEAIVTVCKQAFDSLEEATVRTGMGLCDVAINRRQRDPDGFVRRIGWNPSGFVDISLPVLQSIRPDGSIIATIVAYGAHTVTTGVNYPGYSPDYPGPLRELVREVTGGECVFLLGAAGNIMPRFAFDDECQEPKRMGRRLAIQALDAIADRLSGPAEIIETGFGSGTRVDLFRLKLIGDQTPALGAAEEEVVFPLLPLPTLEEIRVTHDRDAEQLAKAEEAGDSEAELRMLRFHGFNWSLRVLTEIESGKPRTTVSGSVNAVRIGNAVIVTGPGEIFSEIGLAVKERSVADVTFYLGYSNGQISYIPTACEYPLGGYEPSYGHKTYGLPAQVSPETERLLIDTGVRLSNSLFPELPASPVLGTPFTGNRPVPPPLFDYRRPATSGSS